MLSQVTPPHSIASYYRKGIRVRGYDMRFQRVGAASYEVEYAHGWGRNGAFPDKWDELKADPTIATAVIWYASERRKRQEKRRVLDAFTHTESEGAAC